MANSKTKSIAASKTKKVSKKKVHPSRKVNLKDMDDSWQKEFDYDYLPQRKGKGRKKIDDMDDLVIPEDIDFDDNFDDLLGKHDDEDDI